MNNNSKGNLTELQVATCYMQLGYVVCFPYGNKERYDMIIDNGTHLKKVQVKTPVYNINAKSVTINLGTKGKYKSVDYISAFISELNTCIQIHSLEVLNTSITIKLENIKNYEIGRKSIRTNTRSSTTRNTRKRKARKSGI